MADVYDGFISYSHAADDLLAPRLQSALQRFAKPWWKRRAVRIFRDESSLSANPHLWSSITEALDSSGWLVLLLSPDAAASEWVNQEISYWVDNRDPKKILPVVTDGEFGWADGDVSGDAVPDALRGVFSEEPRWVDVRWAKDEEQLDLKDPRFADAVADIASTIRGIPKDDLASEEVRQHRRTVRTAWAAGVALLALTLASVGLTLFALGERNDARSAAAAEAEARAEAAEEADRARASELIAVSAAANAEARRLIADATVALQTDAQLSILLLLAANALQTDEETTAQVNRSLRVASSENRVLGQFDARRGANYGRVSPDGSTVYLSKAAQNRLIAVEVRTSETLWEYLGSSSGREVSQLAISPDGDLLAVELKGGTAKVDILDSASGVVLLTLSSGDGCGGFGSPSLGGFSANGQLFAMQMGGPGCEWEGPDDSWVSIFSTDTWEEVARYESGVGRDERYAMSDDRSLAVWTFRSTEGEGWLAEIISLPGLDVVGQFSIENGRTIDIAGHTVAYAASVDGVMVTRILDLRSRLESELVGLPSSGGALSELTGTLIDAEELSFSPDGSRLAIIGVGRDLIVDVASRDVEVELELDDFTLDASWTSDGSRLLTAHPTGYVLWEIERDDARFNSARASQDWVAFARKSLTRGLTQAECTQYGINPCPTLDEMRSR